MNDIPTDQGVRVKPHPLEPRPRLELGEQLAHTHHSHALAHGAPISVMLITLIVFPFRKTLVRLGMEVCHGQPDAFKAWSQNLGHDEILTTFKSYGEIPTHRQRDLIRAAGTFVKDDRIALELGRQALAAARARADL